MTRRGGRRGFTTGSAASAAAKAALLMLLTGETPQAVDIPLPAAGRLTITLAGFESLGNDQVRASVVKDGGDDPDATHGARIMCRARLVPGPGEPRALIEGGAGVGRVTLPGLAIAPGNAAINPYPLRQIAQAALEAMDAAGYQGRAELIVEVERGQEIAQKTLNARLGILGGISILGTTGIVMPYSHSAWKAAISAGLNVSRAMGLPGVALTTGRASERFLRRQLPELAEQGYIQAADYFAFSLSQAAERGFSRLTLGCFFGKLVKMALGYAYTHAAYGSVDFEILAGWLDAAGAMPATIAGSLEAVTARHVLALLALDPAKTRVVSLLADKALTQARGHAGPRPDLELFVFDFEGGLLHHGGRDGLAGPGATV